MNNSQSLTTEPFAYTVFRYSNIFHVVVGATSNLLVVFLCLLRPKLRECPTYIFLAFMYLACFIYIFLVPLGTFVSEVIRFDLQKQSLYYCRGEAFLDSYSLQFQAWVHVFYTLELYLNARITNFRKKYLSSKKSAIICIIIGVVLIPLNFPTWFIRKSLYPYVCIVTVENTSDVFSYIYRVAYIFSSTVPLVVVITLNALLFREVFNRKKRVFISQNEQVMRNKMRSDIQSIFAHILISTVDLILLIVPRTVYTICALNDPSDSNLFNYMCVKFALQTFFSLNTLVLIPNKPIVAELKAIFSRNRNIATVNIRAKV